MYPKHQRTKMCILYIPYRHPPFLWALGLSCDRSSLYDSRPKKFCTYNYIYIHIYIYIYLIYLSYISYIIYKHLIQTFLCVCTFIYEPYSIKPYFTETMIYVKLDAEATNTAHSYYLYFLYFNEQYIIYIYIYIAIE